MKTLLAIFLLFPLFLNAAYVRHGKEYYKVILTAKPFGEMAANAETTSATLDPVKVEEESNKIQLCAMTITPNGRTAVGLIDSGITPQGYIVLFDGESSNNLEMILSDYEGEFATFRRDGVTFTLKLGMGLIETVTPETLAAKEAEEAKKAAEKAQQEPRHNSLAEQLIAMEMSLPPDVEAPPLPLPIGDPELFVKKFDENKEESEPATESEAIVKAGVEELKTAIANGETPQSYLKRLTEHRQKEVERQQSEKKQAQEALQAKLEQNEVSADDEAYIRRRTNIELIKKGVVPLSPVNDLSEAEQSEINAAINAVQ
ncbi:MAG: hypothetical protein RR133_00035 [Kiritimatiellia bacterium]